MNILDIVDNSTFLKRLYPNGLLRFSVGSIALPQDRITPVLHEETVPAIQVEK